MPCSILLSPRRRQNDLLLTLLHYLPVRKAMDIDVIDEAATFSGEVLRLTGKVREVKVYPTGEKLATVAEGAFVLPKTKGRLLLRVPGYFAKR